VEADVLIARGKAREALVAAEDGLGDQVTYPDLEAEWKLEWRRARALVTLQREAEAIPAYRSAIAHADRLRMAPLGYRLDTTFLSDKLPMANEAIDLAIEQEDAASAVWFIEVIKSRSLSATLSIPRSAYAQRSDDEVKLDVLSQQIDALAFASYSGAAGVPVLQERARLLDERDALLEAVRIRDPRWRLLTEPPPIDISALSTRLGSQRAALVLHYRPGRIVAGVVDGNGVTVGVREVTAEIADALERFVKNLRKARPNAALFDLSAAEQLGLEDLVAPHVLQRAVNAPTLIVIPHGMLHLLPWACMTFGRQRLFELCAVGVLPNLASLPLLDLEPVPEPGVALIGAPDYEGLERYEALPEVPAEMDDIRAIYGSRLIASPYLGSDATEAAFWQLAQEPEAPKSILHVSAHGSLEASEPLASGLILTQSTVDAAELLSRRVRYPEIVLSACSTAWRPQSTRGLDLAGDDALGLPASFLEAGARFMLASVTPTGQKSARRFTVAWHRNRLAGLSPINAYRAVQLELYDDASHAIDQWAGMMAFGCR
jgi:CHAT domain-containing protein